MGYLSCQKNHSPEKKNENSLRINISLEPRSLDSRKASDPTSSTLIYMLFDGLTRIAPDLSVNRAQAEKIEVSEDQKTYTFLLKDTRWSDGSAVTALDFEETWKNILHPEFPAPNAHLLYCIKNARACKEGRLNIDQFGIRSLNNKTLLIELEEPTPYFLQIPSCSTLFPVPQKKSKQDPDWASRSGKNFICNGPFKLSSWKRNLEMTVEKNPHYREAAHVKIDTISISMLANEMVTLHMYASGFLDLLGMPLSPLPKNVMKELDQNTDLQRAPVAGSMICAFNTSIFPFQNIAIRQALGHAIDRGKIVEHVTQLNEPIATGAIPSVLKQGKDTLFFKDGDIETARSKFKQGLKELNLTKEEFPRIILSYWPTEMNHKLAQTIQQQWLTALGIDIRLESLDFKSIMNKVQDGTYHIALFAYLAEYNNPMSILERFRSRKNQKNYAGWENPAFVQLLDASKQEKEMRNHLSLLEEAETLLIDEMPIIPLFHWNFSFLIQPYLKGFSISSLGHIYFDEVSIDEQMKEEMDH